jgi:hypothetical protein
MFGPTRPQQLKTIWRIKAWLYPCSYSSHLTPHTYSTVLLHCQEEIDSLLGGGLEGQRPF